MPSACGTPDSKRIRSACRQSRRQGRILTEVLARLLPAVRDIRNPLAIGYSWIIIAWLLLAATLDSGDDLERSFSEMTSGLSDLVLVAGLTFLAVVLGSGIVRLMDRLMQLTRFGSGKLSNPLDQPEVFWYFRTKSRRRPPEVTYTGALRDYLDENGKSLYGWRVSSASPEARDYDMQMFRDHLADDPDFGALQAEQLLRISMLPPILVSLAMSVAWAASSDDGSPWILVVALAVLAAVVALDYQRTGTLLRQRWQRLAALVSGLASRGFPTSSQGVGTHATAADASLSSIKVRGSAARRGVGDVTTRAEKKPSAAGAPASRTWTRATTEGRRPSA